MNPSDQATDKANAIIAKERDDKATRWHKLWTGQATPEQAAAAYDDLAQICLAHECPAISANFEANRTFHISGRQAVWLELQTILKNKPPTSNNI